MLSRAWMEVDLGALVRNATALFRRAGVPLIPMIKADAYGLGAEQVAHALEHLSPLAYGVATVEEGQELRDAGITRQIIIFTPLLPEEFEAAHLAQLTPTLGSAVQITAWEIYGSPYVLSVDTGMSRSGIAWREAATLTESLTKTPPAAVYTHFHSPQLDDGSMDEQLARFDGVLSQLPSRPPVIHTDSSAAIARHSRSTVDAVRPGIFMYGVGSGPTASLQPEPVVFLKGRIVEIRRVEPGDTVSYDATWTARRPTLIATVPLGYADGYPRGASNTGSAVVRDRVVPVAGRVTMDMTMIDVTDAGAEIGEVATFIGNPGANGAAIDVASVAAKARISPYELLTGLRNRIRRTYRGQ
ncbi:MAG TPA: alanine racemase [Gemmatimonadaceae bacterium]|jgi:alanine racemase|nr:alanine racemase [Gemmatimonadaceae bacterium]